MLSARVEIGQCVDVSRQIELCRRVVSISVILLLQCVARISSPHIGVRIPNQFQGIAEFLATYLT